MSERNRDKVKRLEHELGRYQKKVGELMKANAKLREDKIMRWNDPRTAKARSKTFPGIAKAMAEQWGGDIRECEGRQ